MQLRLTVCLATIAFLAFSRQGIGAVEIRAHPAPPGEPLSAGFKVAVGKLDVPVYVAKVASGDPVLRFKSVDDVATSGAYFEKAAFASFDAQGSLEVTVTCPEPIKTAKLLPSSLGLVPVVLGNRVSFRMSSPALLTLEVNGDWVHSLHLFANPLERDEPREGDPKVMFFGPGIHEVDNLLVPSETTVYIADGAIVRGRPTVHRQPTVWLQGNNITLRGRGILDGSLCPVHTQHLLELHGTNIVVEGIILRDSSVWTVPVRDCQKVKITNIKLFGSRANSDGIDICGSRDVEVSHSFLRTLDDLVVVKTEDRRPAENILVKNCVLWNEVAHALSIGAELRGPVNNVRFRDCDVIHDKGREWTLRVFHCDSALISHVEFENIRIEETRKLISLWIGSFVWTHDAERGHIENVLFKNIQATGDHPRIELKGFDAAHQVEGVKFEHVVVNGKPVGADEVQRNEFVRDVSVSAD